MRRPFTLVAGHKAVVRMLLARKATIPLRNKDGMSAIDLARKHRYFDSKPSLYSMHVFLFM